MTAHPRSDLSAMNQENPPRSRDALRSQAWRLRQANFLRELIRISGTEPAEGSIASYMTQIKKLCAPLWTETVLEAPATFMHHDPSLTRQERRRLSSIKNNRLCRQRHSLFLSKVEAEFKAQGLSSERLTHLKGLVSE